MVGVEDLFRNIAFPLLRFGVFAAHAMICGSVVILLLVLRPAVASLKEEVWEPGRKAMGRRLEGLVKAALIASALFTGLVLLLQAALVSELGTGEVHAGSFAAVLETTFGRWNALRLPLLAALAVLLLGRVKVWGLGGIHDSKSPSRAWWVAWLGLAIALMGTSTFSGHALVATPRWVSVANDLMHLVSGAVWFAGIMILGAVVPDGWRRSPGGPRISLLAPVIANFSHVAMISIGIVFVTGTLNSFLHVGAVNDLWDTSYGQALSVKLVLFAAILGLGAFNHFRMRDRLLAAAATGTENQANIVRRTVAAEVAVALAIMAATGVLTYLSRTKEVVSTGPPSAHNRTL